MFTIYLSIQLGMQNNFAFPPYIDLKCDPDHYLIKYLKITVLILNLIKKKFITK